MSKSTLFKSLTHSNALLLSKLFFKNFDFIKGAINHFYAIFLKSWRKSILLLLSVLTFGLLCEAQLFPGVLNQKCFGGTGFDEANKIISTNDGGFLFLGRYTANGVDGDIIPPG